MLPIENNPGNSQTKKEEYNSIPLLYCKHCLSLLIRGSDGIDYCDKCGGTDIGEAHVEEWQDMCKNNSNTEII